MCAPVAKNSRASAQDRNLRSASTSIPARSIRSPAGRGPGPARSPGTVPATPPAGSRSRTPPPPATALRERPVTGLIRRTAEMRGVRRLVRHVRRRPVHRDDPQPAAEHPRRPLIPDRPRDLLEQEPDRCRAELARGPATAKRCSAASTAARRPRPPSRPGPAPRPAGHRRAADRTARRPAWSSPARTRSSGPGTSTRPARSTSPAGPAAAGAAAPNPGRVHRRIHQQRRENPGQHTDRDPVRQPAVRREPFRTIMCHETVTIPLETLKQGHWACCCGA